ncbi:MAG: EAL domain-containing protein [Rhodocyclales bacterium]|nr:EAL domain-containing protein [Rhodocyclales bacterium]
MSHARVLILDDDAAAASDLQERMRALGVEVLGIAGSGDEAVRRIDALLRDSEKKLRAIFESAADGIVVSDAEGRIVMMNRQAEAISGYGREELLGQQIEALVPEPHRHGHAARCQALYAAGRSCMMGELSQIQLRRKDGSELAVDISLSPVEAAGERLITSIVRDISERRRVETELQRLNRTLKVLSACNQALVRASSEPELLTDICAKLVEHGGYRLAWVGYAEHDAAKTVRPVAHAGGDGDYLARIRIVWADTELGHGPTGTAIRERRTVVCRRLLTDPQFAPWRDAALANGYASSIALPLRDGETVLGALSIYAPVENAFDTEEMQLLEELAADLAYGMVALRREEARRKAQAQLDYLADYDAVTHLANRHLLSNRLGQVIALSEQAQRRLAVLVVDVDRFAAVNESLGHLAGDQLLGDVGRRLLACAGAGDTVARLDGDRFALAAAALGCDEDIDLLLCKVQAAFTEPFTIDGREIGLTASLGVAVHPSGGTTAEALLKNAATAVNRAKQQGYSQFRFYTEDLNAGALARIELEAALRQAVERNELVLHYQPKVDLQSGRVSGVEALLRWQRSGHALVAPLDFIPLAEKTGLIVGIGAWVIDSACRQIRDWLQQGFSDIRVAVNVSAHQLRAGDLKSVVAQALQRHGVAAQHLELELTESMLMESPDDAVMQLRDLKQLGVKLSLDDFGTGYSSLGYLSRFPIDTVKIDRAFVADLVSEPNAASIANSIIMLGHRMRLKVVAEGVENAAQLGYLRQNGCDEMQGYYFSRPLAADALSELLREGKSLPGSNELAGLSGAHTLLVVDDEPSILSSVKRLLRREAYRVITAGSAGEGLELLATNAVQVILSDQRMPEMNGTDFLRRVKELHPDTVRIIFSGYTDLETVTNAVNEGALYKFLTKPWEEDQLREQIRDAFRYYDAVIKPRAVPA